MPQRNESHLAIGQMHDAAAWAESVKIDAAKDREWFRQHPGRSERQRLASSREQRMMKVPPGTLVLVTLLPSGAQARTVFEPDDKN